MKTSSAMNSSVDTGEEVRFHEPRSGASSAFWLILSTARPDVSTWMDTNSKYASRRWDMLGATLLIRLVASEARIISGDHTRAAAREHSANAAQIPNIGLEPNELGCFGAAAADFDPASCTEVDGGIARRSAETNICAEVFTHEVGVVVVAPGAAVAAGRGAGLTNAGAVRAAGLETATTENACSPMRTARTSNTTFGPPTAAASKYRILILASMPASSAVHRIGLSVAAYRRASAVTGPTAALTSRSRRSASFGRGARHALPAHSAGAARASRIARASRVAAAVGGNHSTDGSGPASPRDIGIRPAHCSGRPSHRTSGCSTRSVTSTRVRCVRPRAATSRYYTPHCTEQQRHTEHFRSHGEKRFHEPGSDARRVLPARRWVGSFAALRVASQVSP